MPKGRHLKPDFFTDKNIVTLSPLARLLYQGLWCYAYDCTHLDDEPVELKMRILPADDCDVDALLDELVWHTRVIRKDGVLTLPKLLEHQKPDKRYATLCEACKEAAEKAAQRASRSDHDVTTLCPPRGHDVEQATTTSSATEADQPHISGHVVTTSWPHGDHVGDGDGDGDGDGEVMVKGAAKKRATAIPRDWQPTDAHRAIAIEERVSIDFEAKKFRDSATAKGRTYIDWDAAFRNWLRSPYAPKTEPVVSVGPVDESQLPPVEDSWMKRRPTS